MSEEESRLYISDDIAFITTNTGDIAWIDNRVAKESNYSVVEGCIRQSTNTPVKPRELEVDDHS
jgi:hypothetical protein